MDSFDIGNRIKIIREARRIPQVEIADFLGMDNSNYARIEKKGNKITIETLQKLATFFNLSIFEFLGKNEKTAYNEERINKLKEELDKIKQEREGFKDEVFIQVKQCSELKDKIIAVQDENSKLNQEIRTLNAKITELHEGDTISIK